MAWVNRKIEEKLKELLNRDLSSSAEADEIYGHYTEARWSLVENILPEIKAIEGSLTDHSERHIAHVLDNVWRLLGDKIDELLGVELYFVCITVLFHDVGNIHGRTGHYDRAVIQQIYNYVRNGKPKFKDERRLVCLAASTHSGKASDGSADTMKELPEKKEGLFDEGISLRKLAPVLRLADELAEGYQRTSNFMIKTCKYSKSSMIHHKYAQMTSVYIDRGNGRIAITYDIDIRTKLDGCLTKKSHKELLNILKYTYNRIIKLNEERRFNKFYSELLEPFNRTDVNFNFSVNEMPCDISINELSITDLRIPGSNKDISIIEDIDKSYKIENIVKLIEARSKII